MMPASSALEIGPAQVAERDALIDLQRRASMADPAFPHEVLATPGAIDVPEALLEAGQVFVARKGELLLGFASLVLEDDGAIELEGLFVDPNCWRSGIGRALVERAVTFCRDRGAGKLHVIANPNARGFYRSMDFAEAGQRQLTFGVGLIMHKPIV